MPLLGSRTFGLDAPLRTETRHRVLKWGVLMLVLQDAGVLWQLQEQRSTLQAASLLGMGGAVESGGPLDALDESGGEPSAASAARRSALLACMAMTAATVALNAPRRVSAWAVGQCQARLPPEPPAGTPAKATTMM